MKSEVIERIVARCDGTEKAVQEAVARILMEETPIGVGDTVAVTDEDVNVGGFIGKGIVRGFSENKIWADVELPSGMKTKVQTNTLYLVK